MLLSVRKEPGKYTEGAVLGALVRIVPPPLGLAMTEPEEKAERLRIMRRRHCTELEARRPQQGHWASVRAMARASG